MKRFLSTVKLKTKILVGFILIGVIPALVASILAYSETVVSTHHQAEERLEAMLFAIEMRIEDWTKEAEHGMSLWSALYNSNNQMDNEAFKKNFSINEIVIEKSERFKVAPGEMRWFEYINSDQKRNLVLVHALSATQQVAFYYDNHIINNIANVEGNFETAGFGQTGYVDLVDLQGRQIALGREAFEKNASSNNYQKLSDQATNSVVQGKTGKLDYVDNDQTFWSSYRPYEHKGLSFGLIARINEIEALEEVNVMRLHLIEVVLVSAVIIVIVAWTFSSGLANSIAAITTRLGIGAEQLSAASEQIAAGSVELSQATTQQAASLQETVASLDEISAMVSRNTETSNKSDEIAKQSTLKAQRGRETINEMMSSMSEIDRSNQAIMKAMEDNADQLSEIVRIINEIGDKTNVINDIVFQTKLLSFNASVEAARAGEHGKGFAVVAEEVGNLAQMSGNAAKQISDMLDSSTRKVQEIAQKTKLRVNELIVTAKQKVDEGSDVAKECGQALDEIVSGVTLLSEMVATIAQASNEQSAGIGEINNAMTQLDEATQQNTTVATESSQASESMSLQANELSNIAGELQVIVNGSKSVMKKTGKIKPIELASAPVTLKNAPTESDNRFVEL